MTDRDLFLSATNCSSVRSIEVESSYGQVSATATIECDGTTLALGNQVTIDAGYADNHKKLFFGYVKKIEYQRPDNVIRISCNDELIKAADYFIASDNPESPFQRNNISSLNLVKDLLALASITNVDNTEPSPVFTWGTNADGARFNLQSVADACNFIAQSTGNVLWADTNGKVHLDSRKPYIVGGDTPTHSFQSSGSNMIDINYSTSTDKTRNVVKVYGRDGITAKASGTNSYLIVDQTVVIAHELIDTDSLAQGVADVNLALLNRLTESVEVTIEGDPSISRFDIASVTDVFSGLNNKTVFCYRVNHRIDSGAGYQTKITCVT